MTAELRGLTAEERDALAYQRAQQRAEAWLMANAPKTDPCASPEVLLDETGDEYEPTQVDGRAAG
jgi:hypothetical protein